MVNTVLMSAVITSVKAHSFVFSLALKKMKCCSHVFPDDGNMKFKEALVKCFLHLFPSGIKDAEAGSLLPRVTLDQLDISGSWK